MDIEQYLKSQDNKTVCRFITCGSVDDGKSTMIGRLFYESQFIFRDQLESLEKDSKKFGTVENEIDFALLVDGLESEREQGITIDVAYRYFSTPQRKFIIADAPGHEEYTRNMVTGASTANLAIILIDGREGKGVISQTKRHSYIVALMGIRHIMVAVNKMDLVDFSESRFKEIQSQYRNIISHLPNCEHIEFDFIPISALHGDNMLSRSHRTPWYRGLSLMEFLNTVEIKEVDTEHFRFPVQYVNRPNLNFRGFCGTVVSGQISVGDRITVLPSRKTGSVKSIIGYNISEVRSRGADESIEGIAQASAPMSITLTLDKEIDISRGDMIVKSEDIPIISDSDISRGDIIVKSEDIPMISDRFSVMLIWMNESPMHLENRYIIKRGSSLLGGSFSSIDYLKEISSFSERDADKLELNDIGRCSLELDRPLAVDTYHSNRYTGGFIVINRHTNETMGAGMIIGKINHIKGEGRKNYSDSEIALNRYVRKFFPEWGCEEVL